MADISQVKVGSTNYDLKDATARSGNVPNGGTQGQTLMKASATDKDTEWRMPTYHFQTKAALDAAIANGDIPANGALATVDENPPVGIEGDTALSTTSENWVQNKVVTTAINGVNSDLADKEKKHTVLSQTLSAGSTTVTFTTIPTSGNYIIEFSTSLGINYTEIDTTTAGQVTLTFEAQSAAVTVYCDIKEVA